MNLPSKDKNGNCYLSYSQISTFLKDKDQYYRQYILQEPFIGNAYTEFGSKVGKALELNDFSQFSGTEVNVLKKLTRLDVFERKIIINFSDFYLIGFIDSCSNDLTKIIDYKTGGQGKESQYKLNDYTQLIYYTLGIRQETNINVKEASVEFITRSGNAFKGDKLLVSNTDPIKIEIDLSEQRLKQVYWQTERIAKEIETFYLSTL